MKRGIVTTLPRGSGRRSKGGDRLSHHFITAGLLPVLQVATFAALARFLVAYVRRVPGWYRTLEGRYLVVSKASFALILGLGLVAAVWPGWVRWGGRDYVRAGVYVVLAVVFVWLNVVADLAWRQRGRDDDEEVSGGVDDTHPGHPGQR